jgi:hypothetical protein
MSFSNKIYTFEIKFGIYHQKVTITMNPLFLTMDILREVAIRFIQTMVCIIKKKKHKINFLFLIQVPRSRYKIIKKSNIIISLCTIILSNVNTT